MPQFQQVSGGACSLTIYPETRPGVVAAGVKGVKLAFMSESFKKGSSKKQSTVIRGARGPGKPYTGLPQMSGQMESAAYAPQMGFLMRALCGAPTTTTDRMRTLDTAIVVELDAATVGLPCAAHGFVQDDVLSISGTVNYDGVYRVAPGVTKNMLAIQAPYVSETLPADTKVCRGRAVTLSGTVQDLSDGNVSLPVSDVVHSLNAGEQITISGTTNYDGKHVLKAGTGKNILVIAATYVAETFIGEEIAMPVFFSHAFLLPRRQPTICMEKYIDYEAGAAVNAYRRFSFCKVNGWGFSLGGDEELKFSLDFAVGRETLSPVPLDDAPHVPNAVTFDNIESSLWVGGVRRGDIESANFTNNFGISPKAAVGDMGQYSRMPEGDPDCTCTMSAFLESDELQNMVDAAVTVEFSTIICSVTGEQVTFTYPESELDSDGPAITGKEGLMQEVTVLPFVDQGNTVMTMQLINRVATYV